MGSLASVAEIEAALAAVGDPVRADHERRYLKSTREHYGTGMPAVHRIAKGVGRLDHAALVDLVEALWAHPAFECSAVAVDLLVHHVRTLGPTDLPLIERMIRTAGTWALVDGLAGNVVGPIADTHAETATVLDRWAGDDDFWVRRSALLAHLVPLRRGGGDFARFVRYADAMLDEREFFIRKAIGWVLRDAARNRPELVFDWLLPRAARASGVTIREAVKHLTEDQRAAVLAAHRGS